MKVDKMKYAKEEIKRLKVRDEIRTDIMAILKTLDKSIYDNDTVGYILSCVIKLQQKKPLTQLTGEAREWGVYGNCVRNKRCPMLMRYEDGAYYESGHFYKEPWGNNWFFDYGSKEYVEFPCYPPEYKAEFRKLFFKTRYVSLKWAIKFHLYRKVDEK